MSSSKEREREDSPDWLRSFQTPAFTFSSDSASSPNGSPSRWDEDVTQTGAQEELPSTNNKISKANPPKSEPNKKKRKDSSRDGDDGLTIHQLLSRKHPQPSEERQSDWALSSDSASCPDNSPIRDTMKFKVKASGKDEDPVPLHSKGVSPVRMAPKSKSPKKLPKGEGHTQRTVKNEEDNVQRKVTESHEDVEITEEGTFEKHISAPVSTSRLPLVLSEKVQRSKALVECEGESIDLSGDMGAVGRVVIPNTSSGNPEMYLDLKGTIYRTTLVSSRTFCVVSFGQSEAKIEAIMNDFIQLKTQSNVYEAETMVEGTLEGFSFDSEDEADKIPKDAFDTAHQTDQGEGAEEPTNGKPKGKAEKSSEVVRKRGKTAAGKPQPAKKARKKAQISKKAKTKK